MEEWGDVKMENCRNRNLHRIIVSCFLVAVACFLFTGCGKKQGPPVTLNITEGISISLSGSWEHSGSQARDGITVTVLQGPDKATITAAVTAAREIPFTAQVEQDRNNLNLKKEYKILLEKNTQVGAHAAYIFIVTSVESGTRFKSKIVLLQKDRQLVYLTLKATLEGYEQAVPDFNAMLDAVK